MYKSINILLISFALLFLGSLTNCSTVSESPEGIEPVPVPIEPHGEPAETPVKPVKPVVTYPRPSKFSTDSHHYHAQGTVSWYSLSEHGMKTASGEVYDLYGMTAAHATLPFLSRVNVRNLDTGASVIVTINDRLENDSSTIRLSYEAARRLGLLKQPNALVDIQGLPAQPFSVLDTYH